MNNISRRMIILQKLDRDAHIRFSWITQQWYVTASKINIKRGFALLSPVIHAETPALAVKLYLNQLINLSDDEVVVTDATSANRKEWNWSETDSAWEVRK